MARAIDGEIVDLIAVTIWQTNVNFPPLVQSQGTASDFGGQRLNFEQEAGLRATFAPDEMSS